MKRLFVVLIVFCVVMVSLLAAPITATAQDIKQLPQNLGTAFVNIPGSFANGVKGTADEVQERGVVSIVSGPVSFGLNVGITAVSSALTFATLGLVPPVSNAWSKDPPPVVFPKK